ncbi:MAG: family 2 glycosyl transferase [Hyphomicrobiales bacterium]|nr:family 2 glycosyl transferase [Hyphomicrobiales bacterium]
MTTSGQSSPSVCQPSLAPLVSVIVPIYNSRAFLPETMASVFAQDLQDFEILLVDDGSTDGSAELAEAYAAQHPGRVHYLQHEEHANKGASASRNLGIAHARGEFLALLDADDVWRPAKLREQLAIMRDHPDVGMVTGSANYWQSWAGGPDWVVQTGDVRNTPRHPPHTALALYPLGRAHAPCPSEIMLRRDLVQKIGFSEDRFRGIYGLYEDQTFLAKIYLAAPVYFSDRVWIDYRQHPQSIMATVLQDGRYDEVRQFYLSWYRDYLKSLPSPPPAEIIRALDRAERPYRFPRLYKLARKANGAVRRCRDGLRAYVRSLRTRTRSLPR